MIPLLIFVQSLSPIIIVVLFLLIVGLVTYFAYVYLSEKRFLRSEEKVLSTYEKTLAKAHKQAREILSKASEKAEKLINKTNAVSKETTYAINKNLADETIATMVFYQQKLQEVQQETFNTLEETVQHVQQLASKELNAYRQTIEKDMSHSRDLLAKQTEEELQKAKEEVEKYKKEQFAHIDTAVKKMTQELAQQVLGKSLSVSDHKTLLEQALMRAKEEGVL